MYWGCSAHMHVAVDVINVQVILICSRKYKSGTWVILGKYKSSTSRETLWEARASLCCSQSKPMTRVHHSVQSARGILSHWGLAIPLWHGWKNDLATPCFFTTSPEMSKSYCGIPGPLQSSFEPNNDLSSVKTDTPDTVTLTLHARTNIIVKRSQNLKICFCVVFGFIVLSYLLSLVCSGVIGTKNSKHIFPNVSYENCSHFWKMFRFSGVRFFRFWGVEKYL